MELLPDLAGVASDNSFVFNAHGNGRRDAIQEDRRSGAQQGAFEWI
jgi:hypothetical protein